MTRATFVALAFIIVVGCSTEEEQIYELEPFNIPLTDDGSFHTTVQLVVANLPLAQRSLDNIDKLNEVRMTIYKTAAARDTDGVLLEARQKDLAEEIRKKLAPDPDLGVIEVRLIGSYVIPGRRGG